MSETSDDADEGSARGTLMPEHTWRERAAPIIAEVLRETAGQEERAPLVANRCRRCRGALVTGLNYCSRTCANRAAGDARMRRGRLAAGLGHAVKRGETS